MPSTILIRGGYTATNIGNAFYVKGAEYILNKVAPESRIITVTDHPDYYWSSLLKKESTFLDYAAYVSCDYLVLLGPMLDKSYAEKFGAIYNSMDRKKMKICLLSAGGGSYDEDEVQLVRSFLKKYPHFSLFTRDHETYEAYHDLFEVSYDGICFALFASDFCKPYQTNLSKYMVMNFDSSDEPGICKLPDEASFPNDGMEHFVDAGKMIRENRRNVSASSNTAADKLSCKLKNRLLQNRGGYGISEQIGGLDVIRTIHTCIPDSKLSNTFKKNVYLSDVAEDYLNLYANAEYVFTDRLHAAVASISYGTPVYLRLDSPRANLLKRIGCEKVMNGLYKCNNETIAKEKKNLVAALKRIFI